MTQLSIELGKAYVTFQSQVKKYGFETAVKISKTNSTIEILVVDILTKNKIDFIRDKRIKFITENIRPDFYIPSLNIVIECDGLFWHSDLIIKNKDYHLKKKEIYDKYNLKSLFFREDELLYKKEIVTSILNNTLGINSKIGARKCNISYENCNDFFETNHLMGKGTGKDICLKYNEEIVAAIKFRIFDNTLKIERFCTKLNFSVVGGYSKLISELSKNIKVEKIETFVDCRYGTGVFLLSNGFNKVSKHLGFKWVDCKAIKTYNRLKFKNKTGYDKGLRIIYDCGQIKFVKVVRTKAISTGAKHLAIAAKDDVEREFAPKPGIVERLNTFVPTETVPEDKASDSPFECVGCSA